MIGIAPHRLAAVVAAGALVLLTGACSSGESDTGSAASTVTVTAPGSSATTQGSDEDTGSGAAPATDAPATETPAADTQEDVTPAPVARPVSDFADGSRYSFASPSKQIQCRAIEGNFMCQTSGNPHTVTTASLCNFYPGLEQSRAVRFGWFPSGPAPCATIIQGEGFNSPHTLGYGQRVTFSPMGGRTITCASAVDGLTCTQVGGAGATGFFLSVDSFTVL
ncbi:hypothetical protein [Williamsia phyllosphaerae]|uniref:Uncharacterized protein n=1 Tax=Williamsia phyllosphaerae TaxID=885042 RepID=A0ABQ1UE73_9NOCA|nr:hypothetical protein [Williamsia phyllosphaerae]GGF15174.1 hypothetical protein GCM10007298_09020 [Williamsia phyllosphaerae]